MPRATDFVADADAMLMRAMLFDRWWSSARGTPPRLFCADRYAALRASHPLVALFLEEAPEADGAPVLVASARALRAASAAYAAATGAAAVLLPAADGGAWPAAAPAVPRIMTPEDEEVAARM